MNSDWNTFFWLLPVFTATPSKINIKRGSEWGLVFSIITSAEREVKDSRRSGMYQSYNFLTRLGMQSL